MRAFRCAAVVLMLALLLGLHGTALQTIAWARMLVRYSRSVPFRAAVAMTFDGQHPCSLCRAIKEGRDSDPLQPRSVSQDGAKWDCDLPSDTVEVVSRFCRVPTAVRVMTWSARSDDPPKPRPRFMATA